MASDKKMKLVSALAAGLLLTGLSSVANADYIPWTWTDVVDPSPDITIPPAYDYTHDLKDNGADSFRPGLGYDYDYIDSYSLSLHLYDDNYDSWFSAGEWAVFDGSGWADDQLFFNLQGAFEGTTFEGASLIGWLQLNLTGTYDVVVSSWGGDFMFDASRLDARGYRRMPVPEPGTIALLAIGLIGMGVALSRRRIKKNKQK